jgi:hypothetical protein
MPPMNSDIPPRFRPGLCARDSDECIAKTRQTREDRARGDRDTAVPTQLDSRSVFPQGMRETALDQLNRSAQLLRFVERQQYMNVIRHHHVIVKLEFAGVTIFEERRDHEISNLVRLEQVLLHVCTSRDEVSRHDCFGAKAPHSLFGPADANLKVRSTVLESPGPTRR